MDWIVLLPILAFTALAAGVIVVFRRTGSIVGKTRETEGFRSSVRDLCGRIDASLAGAAARIDQVRHHEIGPDMIGETLTDASDAVDRFLDEAKALRVPSTAAEIRDDLVSGLERAGRALATVEHGTTIMASVRGGARELEAQTSIKRGYLNLIHARDYIARQASLVDGLTTRPDRT
jgi:ABC-type transporter Mla subunit MlaD